MPSTIKFIFGLLFCIAPFITYGQEITSAKDVIRTLNEHFEDISQGVYYSTYRYKSVAKTDTSIHSGKIYFFKQPLEVDSFSRFIIYWEGVIDVVYDGTYYYNIDTHTKRIRARTVNLHGGIQHLLKGNEDLLCFKPLLYSGRPLFVESRYASSEIKTIKYPDWEGWQITRQEKMKNPYKLGVADPDTMTIKVLLEVSKQDLSLRKRIEWVHYLGDEPQYWENQFSNITPIADSLTFEDYFQIDSFVQNGYFIYGDLGANLVNTNRSASVIATGQTLPDFCLPNTSGDTICASDSNANLVLLDFWYRSCHPCLRAMPTIEKIYKKYRTKGLNVYGINVDNASIGASLIQQFLDKRGINYPTLLDPEKTLPKQCGIFGYPFFVLYDTKTRKILFTQKGLSEDLEMKISSVIHEHVK